MATTGYIPQLVRNLVRDSSDIDMCSGVHESAFLAFLGEPCHWGSRCARVAVSMENGSCKVHIGSECGLAMQES